MADLLSLGAQPLAGWSHTPIRVAYGDVDAMGVVYYAHYLRWFELGRGAYLRQRGGSYRLFEARGLLLPVREARCRYLRPARYDQVVRVACGLVHLGRSRVVFGYRVEHGGETLAQGVSDHALVDGELRPRRLPDPLRELLLRSVRVADGGVGAAGGRPQEER